VTDRRLTPANGRVAAAHLRGQVAAERYVAGEAAAVAAPVADLRAGPGGGRNRQLLWGEAVTVYEREGGWAFVQAARDGYVGYLEEAALGPPVAATHVVAVPATHLYTAPDIRAPELCGLSFGARLRVVSGRGAFLETDGGLFVPRVHLRPANRPFADPATVAQLFFGAPYLWGGNSIRGIDCSGLVQAALLACAIPCPGDSDLQAAHPGFADLAPDTPLERGDLVFWRGHVGLMVDDQTLLHANAHHMAVAYEPIAEAAARIDAAGGGPIVARRRPPRS
jgi:cell wall-associated NlpC family hydrolase